MCLLLGRSALMGMTKRAAEQNINYKGLPEHSPLVSSDGFSVLTEFVCFTIS